MSRAFVKETDSEAVEELPDRPISTHPNIVTATGLAQIETEVARLQADYTAAQARKDHVALASLARDLRYWTARHASAEQAPPPPDAEEVRFGTHVTIVREDGRRQTYRIVGEDEADPARGTLSYAAPLARLLMGKRVGDAVTLGGQEVEVVAIEVTTT
ncbi:MAG: transcription elongation factor GreA [Rhizobiales bacterium]|nr:transcription elongation factor GreA [Hyphomicrobiales bacterium]